MEPEKINHHPPKKICHPFPSRKNSLTEGKGSFEKEVCEENKEGREENKEGREENK